MKKIPADVNPKIGKLVAAIAQKRRELGFLEWGKLPLEEIIKRMQEEPPTEDLAKFTSTLLSQDQEQAKKPSKSDSPAKK